MFLTEMMTQQADLLRLLLQNVGSIFLLYLYFAICIHVLAWKTQTPYEYLAYIPIANLFLMLQVAKKPWWWVILLFIPLLNLIIIALVWAGIARQRGKSGWAGVLVLIPVVNFFVPAYLAFSK